jgi:hypothetical protein
MKDTEIRGLLLRKYYERRRNGLVGLTPDDFDGQLSQEEILWVSSQLGEHGLILWKSAESGRGPLTGVGKISASGIDVVEGASQPPIAIHFSNHSVNVTGSIGVNVGNHNQQTISIQLQELVEAIEKGPGSDDEKREAKSRLRVFLEHPLVSALVGAAATVFTNKAN